MFSTGHALLGIYLVQVAPHPLIGGALALGSHYLLDVIPHGDEGLGRWIKVKPKRILPVEMLDLFVLGWCVYFILANPNSIHWTTVVIGAVAATLPDWLSELYSESHRESAPLFPLAKYIATLRPLDRWQGWHHDVHHRLHHYFDRPIPWWIGFPYQVGVTGFFLWLLIGK